MISHPALVPLTPAARSVVDAIVGAGGRPLVVGGAVRDALFGLTDVKDVDIEVYGVGEVDALQRALSALGPVDHRGKSFGVLALRVDGEDFDVSFPRRDSKSGAGHRGFDIDIDPNLSTRVAFGRRDFTINAIGWDPVTGEVVDPYGGQADIEARVLRHTTDAFAEDPLRVLRAVQFAGRFGLTLAPETAAECRRVSALMQRAGGIGNVVSRERIWGEWRKLVRRGEHMQAAMDVLRQTGLLRLFPDLYATVGVQQDACWHPEGDVWTHSVLAADAAASAAARDGLDDESRELAVLGALCHDLGKVTASQLTEAGRITNHGHDREGVEPTRSFLSSIGAPDALVGRVIPLVRQHMRHQGNMKPSRYQVRRLMRALNPDGNGPTIQDWARVVDADCAGRGQGSKPSPAGAWVQVAETIGERAEVRLLRGEHLIAAGLRPGPHFRELLHESVRAQDAGEFETEEGAARWLDSRLAADAAPGRD